MEWNGMPLWIYVFDIYGSRREEENYDKRIYSYSIVDLIL